jgi:hypothetical protein
LGRPGSVVEADTLEEVAAGPALALLQRVAGFVEDAGGDGDV